MRTKYRSTGPKRTRRSNPSTIRPPQHRRTLWPAGQNWTFFAFLGLLAAVFSADTARAQGPLTNGWTHTGLIGVGGEVDSWTFDANVRDTIVIRVGEITQTNNFTPRIRLMNPLGIQQVVDSGPVVVGIAATATNTGTFTVMIDGVAANATGAYRVTLLKAPGAFAVAPGDEGGPLTNGVTHTGNIDVGDVDVWTFSANAGDNLTLRMGELTAGGTLTPGLWIYGPNGAQLDFFGSSTVAAEVSVRATNSGTFTVAVADFNAGSAYGGIGGYRLTLAKTGSPVVISPGDEGGPLTNGFTYTGNIDAGDIDVWTFTANAGDNIFVAMGESVAGGALTPALWLYGPNGAPLASYGSSSVAAEINTRATNSGTFTVVAGDFSNGYAGSGAYRLTLVKTGDPIVLSSDDQGGPLTNGVTHTGDIYVGDLDIWNFTASAGENITVRVGELVSGSPLHPAIWLLGPNGAQLDVYNASAIAGEVSVRATNNGTFTVVVGDWNNGYAGSGAYRLTLAKTGSPVVISPGDEGGPMINGVTYTGTIDVGDLDVWSFNASAGDSIFVAMGESVAGSSLTPALWFYGPDGRLVASYLASTVASEVYFRATNSGTFMVVAGDWSNGYAGSGAYRLTMVKSGDPITVSPGDHGGPLTNGVTHTGDIYVGDLDIWNFTASAGENLTLRVGELISGSALHPALWIFGPTGAQLDSYLASGFAGEVSVRATNSGTFTVVVGDWSNGYAGSGAYRLTLAKTGSPIVISAGDEGGTLINGLMHTGVIDLGDLDVWTFTANAGESIVVRMGETAAGSALTPGLWLYGPDGRLLDWYASSTIAAEVSFRATNSGTFTVVAGDYSNAYGGTGAYRLTLAKTGSPVEVSPGDEGGPLNGSDNYDGTLEAGDLDVFYFTLCRGDEIVARLDEGTVGSSLTPWIRLYGRDGTLIRTISGAATAQFSVLATNTGTFVLVLGDLSNAYTGSGAYRLTVNGLSAGLKMCVPSVAGTNVNLTGVGGVSGEEFVVLTSPLVEAPLATWSPLFTNLFDFYGTFNRTSRFISTESRRFYIIRQGGGNEPN